MSKNIAGFFITDVDVLSPFAAFPVEWRGKTYATAEHAYQAAHFFDTDADIAEQVCSQPSPLEAFLFANKHAEKEDKNWSSKKVAVMEEITRAKIKQHDIVRQILLQTEAKDLVETNDEDSFWGWGPGPDHIGRNELGKIWMRVRDEINS